MPRADFFRDKHDASKFTAPSKGINSVFGAEVVSAVRASVYAHGTAIAQPGRATGYYAQVSDYSAQIVPSGGMSATGYSNHWFIAQANTPQEHLMAYPKEIVRERFEGGRWIPTGM